MDNNVDLIVTQRELLCMIKDIHKICVTNGIQYSLTGGSLLGSIRENGFIPWDDDIDIMVDRTNYNRLCSAMRLTSKYEMGRGPWLQHIQPINYNSDIVPYVDVFIMDKLPNSKWKAKLKILLLRLLQGMLKEQVEYSGFSFFYKICIFISNSLGKLFTREYKLRLYDKVSQIGDSQEAVYISITNDSFGLLTKKHSSDLLDSFEMHRFEDTELMVTEKYTDYLTTRYGDDYMTPPKESERISGQHRNRPKVENERLGI